MKNILFVLLKFRSLKEGSTLYFVNLRRAYIHYRNICAFLYNYYHDPLDHVRTGRFVVSLVQK